MFQRFLALDCEANVGELFEIDEHRYAISACEDRAFAGLVPLDAA
jgi:hypothetical protein